MPTHRPSSLFTWGEVGTVGTWRGGVPNPFRICKCIDKNMFVLCQWVETSGKHGLIGTTQISGSVCCRHGYNGLFNWCYGSIPPEPIVGKSMPQVAEIVVFTCFYLIVWSQYLPIFPSIWSVGSNPNGGRSPAKTLQLRKQMARSCRGIKDDFCEGARSGASCQSFWIGKDPRVASVASIFN